VNRKLLELHDKPLLVVNGLEKRLHMLALGGCVLILLVVTMETELYSIFLIV
jgi:hypothetical protein